MGNKINFILAARKILSVNSIYSAKLNYTPRGPVPSIYKTGEAKRVEQYIGDQIYAMDVPKNYPWFNKNLLFKMDILVIFKEGYLLRDLDNTIKLLQDSIARALGFNDSHIVEIHAHKKLFPGIGEEKILVSLSEVPGDDIRYDIIPRPWKVWCETNIFGLKSLPKRGAKKDALYWTSCIDSADTFIFDLRQFDPGRGFDVVMKSYEVMTMGKGFLLVILPDNIEDYGLRTKLKSMSAVYSGIKTYNSEEDLRKELFPEKQES